NHDQAVDARIKTEFLQNYPPNIQFVCKFTTILKPDLGMIRYAGTLDVLQKHFVELKQPKPHLNFMYSRVKTRVKLYF
ncbi:hypothetical protein, partial [Photobacterium sanctipauli]